jgi:hypothetical protein
MAGTDGWIRDLQDNPAGTVVKKDQMLATFFSREFRNAEQAYLGSLASIDRVKGTRDGEDTRLSDSSVRVNEEQLRTLGMGEPQIRYPLPFLGSIGKSEDRMFPLMLKLFLAISKVFEL